MHINMDMSMYMYTLRCAYVVCKHTNTHTYTHAHTPTRARTHTESARARESYVHRASLQSEQAARGEHMYAHCICTKAHMLPTYARAHACALRSLELARRPPRSPPTMPPCGARAHGRILVHGGGLVGHAQRQPAARRLRSPQDGLQRAHQYRVRPPTRRPGGACS